MALTTADTASNEIEDSWVSDFDARAGNWPDPDLTGQFVPNLPLYPEVLLSPHCSHSAPWNRGDQELSLL